MNTIVLLTLTGLGLGSLYYLVAAGLSLIFGLMDVVNFAHGAFLTAGGYAAWWLAVSEENLGVWGFVVATIFGIAVGATVATAVEVALIRPLYRRQRDQILVTVGLGLALPALAAAIWGADARTVPIPRALAGTIEVAGASVPVDRFVLIGVALLALLGLRIFLRRTRYGLVVRAGAEDRVMVTALGIDVRRAFTVVFALGGALAGLGGALAGMYYGSVDPGQGTSLLIFAFVVVVVGGLRPTTGVAVAAGAIGLIQQFGDYYLSAGLGDLAVVAVLAVTLLLPDGLIHRGAGKAA